MTRHRPLPQHVLGLDTKVSHPRGHRSPEGTEQHRRAPVHRTRRKASEHGIFDPVRDLGIERSYPIEQRRGHLAPPDHVGTPDDNKLLWRDTQFPGGKRAEPTAYVEIGNRPSPGVVREHRQPESSEPGTGCSEQRGHPARKKRGEIDLRREMFLCSFGGDVWMQRHAGPPLFYPRPALSGSHPIEHMFDRQEEEPRPHAVGNR